MLNDPSYVVGIYTKDGKVGEYSPYADSRKMIAEVIAETTGISANESESLANAYEFTKSNATSMINLSKEFVNTYLQTGRKLPLGGREKMDGYLYLQTVEETTKQVPSKNTNNERKSVVIPSHSKVKSSSSCPKWLK